MIIIIIFLTIHYPLMRWFKDFPIELCLLLCLEVCGDQQGVNWYVSE